MTFETMQRRHIIEQYRRRCKRILALFNAGRIITDNVIIHKTNMMRIGYETAMKEII